MVPAYIYHGQCQDTPHSMPMTNDVYLATVLLEPNRWGSRDPSIDLREWLPRVKAAGFDGIEIWDDHLLKTEPAVAAAIASDEFPTILNHYDTGLDASSAAREKLHKLITHIGCRGMKWNGPKGTEGAAECLRNMRPWIEQFPSNFLALCECHPGTVFENIPEFAESTANWNTPPPVILHLLNMDADDVHYMLTHFPERVAHIHLQMRHEHDNSIMRLDERPDLFQEQIKILKDADFAGSYSIEFTKGCTHADGPDIETLFSHALQDLKFLRGELNKS